MSLSDFEVIKRLGNFQFIILLGEGAYSSVYNIRRFVDGKIYALKKVKMGKLSDKEKDNALNEVRILASIQHKSICAYHEAFIDEPS
jgi:NIMA (never in mitosis gene a)-related kinase